MQCMNSNHHLTSEVDSYLMLWGRGEGALQKLGEGGSNPFFKRYTESFKLELHIGYF